MQVLNYPVIAGGRRPPARGKAEHLAARRGEQRADLAVIQRAGVAELLPQPAEQRELFGGGADADRPASIRSPICCTPRSADPIRSSLASGSTASRARACGSADVATIYPRSSLELVNHYTVQRELDIAANVDGRDLGAIAADIQKAISEVSKGLPITTKILILGQNDVMQSSFRSLGSGMVLAVLLVYALLVILFQSWVDPFIIMMAVPGALMGILWMLALTQHHDQRRVADGRDHVDRHFGVQFHPGRELRQRSARA